MSIAAALPFYAAFMAGLSLAAIPVAEPPGALPLPGRHMPAGTLFRECPGCPEMMVVPRGRGRIGSPAGEPGRAADEGPARDIHMESFAIGRFEITLAQYHQFLQQTGYKVGGHCITDRRRSFDWQPDPATTLNDPGFGQREDHPVVCVSWNDAMAYVAWLNRLTGGGYRLPSEAEWEYAARAGTISAYHWGEDVNAGCAFINGTDETARRKYPQIEHMKCTDGALNTAPVGSYRPNRFGLFDTTGNVGEWTSSCATPDYAGLGADGTDASGDCSKRMVRGGSWGTIPRQQRSAERMRYAPGARDDSIGIRLVRTLDRPVGTSLARAR